MRKEHLAKLRDVLSLAPEINGGEEYFMSAILVLLVWQNDEYHLVFQKRALKIRQGGEICFPGGHYDPTIDPDFEHTAIRETVEELGIAEEKLSIIGKLNILISPMGAIIKPYVGIADIQTIAELNPDKDEVDYIFTVPLAFFEINKPEEYQVCFKSYPYFIDNAGTEIVTFPSCELGLPERYAASWGDRKHKIYIYRVQGEIIWGSTAKIILDFIQRTNSVEN